MLYTTESWFGIWRPIVICLIFCLSRRKSRQVQTCFVPPSPFTCSRWRFDHPLPRALSYCLMSPYPLIWGPRNFATFSPVWPQQPLELVSLVVRHFFIFVRFVAASCRTFVCICGFVNLKPSIVLCELLYLCLIQFSVAIATELSNKLVLSFLGNIFWCIDRESFPLRSCRHSSSSLEPLVTFRAVSCFCCRVPVAGRPISSPLPCSCCWSALIFPIAVFVIFPVRWIATAKRIQLVIDHPVFLIPALGCWIVVAESHLFFLL